MKTIGYADRAHPKVIKAFTVEYTPEEVKYTRHDRMSDAWKEIEHLGNCYIYLIRGKKYRKIATR